MCSWLHWFEGKKVTGSWKGDGLWENRGTLSAASANNKSLNGPSLLVLGQRWANHWKLGALINPQLMVCAKCYSVSYHTRDRTSGFLGWCPGREGCLASICITVCPHSTDGYRIVFYTTGWERVEKVAPIDSEWSSLRDRFTDGFIKHSTYSNFRRAGLLAQG